MLNPPAIVRPADDLADLANAINADHEAGEQDVRRGLKRFRAAGEKLIRAKAACGAGNWLAWVRKNLRFNERRAQRYMALARTDETDEEQQWRAICGHGLPGYDAASYPAAQEKDSQAKENVRPTARATAPPIDDRQPPPYFDDPFDIPFDDPPARPAQPAPPPPPAPVRPRSAPAAGKPRGGPDPAEEVKAAVTQLARRLTVFMNACEDGYKFKKYLLDTGHGGWLDTRDVTVRLPDGRVKTYPVRWRGFGALKWFLHLAGQKGVRAPEEVRHLFRQAQSDDEAGDDWKGDD